MLFVSAGIAACTLAQKQGALEPVDVDFMVRGYFHASSPGPGYLNGLGGWGASSNAPAPFIRVPGRTGVEVLVDTLSVEPWDGVHRGQDVFVRNHGPDTAFFPAQDSRLYMWTQASQGDDFADIEYLPSSWCGNSYHTLFLAPGEQWHFVMPKYEGRKAARLRLTLRYQGRPEGGEEHTIHSHTFPGGVNKGQFSRKQGHQPQGLMDPYDD